MKIRVSERHIKLRPAVRQSLIEKLEGLERYLDRIISIEAVVEGEKEHFVVRLVAHMVRKKIAKAESQSDDVFLAINDAVDSLKTQLSKFKEQLKDHRVPSNAAVPGKEAPQSLSQVAPGTSADGSSGRPAMTRTEVYIRKPMTVDEALIQLEDYNRDLYMFEDSEGGGLRILFRHPDGQLELIDPKF